ncbi:MAG: ribbon-helix-helix domain-containing protein [Hyphomicrobium sp.]
MKKNLPEVRLMCRILSSQPASAFAYQTRSVRLGGHATSIKLEAAFWEILEEIAAELNKPLGRFLTELHDEVIYISGDTHNFTSLLRCACLTYLSEIRGRPDAISMLEDKPRRLFDGPLEAAE